MPPGFQIGPFEIRFYGIILMLATIAGAWLATYQAKRKDEDPEIVWDALVWVLIAGIIGARLWHIFTPSPTSIEQGLTTNYYLTHPLDAIAIWNGGLGIPGAVLGGALAMYLYCRKRNVSFLVWADIVAPGLALAQAIGRWGNFVNQELYGAPSNMPWAIRIDLNYRLPGYEEIAYYHPLFLYESLWNLANLAFLLWLDRKKRDSLKNGDIFIIYLITYPIGRFLLEFLRLDQSMIGGINANQAFMLIIASSAIITLFLRHRIDTTSESPVQPQEINSENAEDKEKIEIEDD
jgi:phosphatidylglycerol---prolipoprotein diacylglyceryl transferase